MAPRGRHPSHWALSPTRCSRSKPRPSPRPTKGGMPGGMIPPDPSTVATVLATHPESSFLKAVPLGSHNKISRNPSSPQYTDAQKPQEYKNIAQRSAGGQWPSSFEPRSRDIRPQTSALCPRVSGLEDHCLKAGPWTSHQFTLA